MADLDYLAHLRADSARFTEVLATVSADTPVPTCPDWNAADLAWHLAEVQHFWASITRERCRDPRTLQATRLSRPAGYPALLAMVADQSAELGEILAQTSPDTPAWSWATTKTVGFSYRRQAHEALIHRLDAELTAGARTPLDPTLGADGVEEVLQVMYGGPRRGEEIVVDDPGATVDLVATDTADWWSITLAHRYPTGGTAVGQTTPSARPGLVTATAAHPNPALQVRAAAADLDAWLWGRPVEQGIEIDGDAGVQQRLEDLLAAGPG